MASRPRPRPQPSTLKAKAKADISGLRPRPNITADSIMYGFVHFSSEKNSQKMLPPELLFTAQICTKSFVGWGFASDPTGEAHSAPPDTLTGLGGGVGSRGKGRKREGEREMEEKKGEGKRKGEREG